MPLYDSVKLNKCQQDRSCFVLRWNISALGTGIDDFWHACWLKCYDEFNARCEVFVSRWSVYPAAFRQRTGADSLETGSIYQKWIDSESTRPGWTGLADRAPPSVATETSVR
ncbi:hypothetical protein ZHAS_00010120 [Anopheles sinensis]|uniref:Uncharacterized protein n=1 Tax=Anopheles sinensis TaxID=74873 RepID=A0A084VWS9_ANOSI|nr:hypothetical protein ZHAS_00010120 [Anopheles sinensis]